MKHIARALTISFNTHSPHHGFVAACWGGIPDELRHAPLSAAELFRLNAYASARDGGESLPSGSCVCGRFELLRMATPERWVGSREIDQAFQKLNQRQALLEAALAHHRLQLPCRSRCVDSFFLSNLR